MLSFTAPILREEHVRQLTRVLDESNGRALWVDLSEVECPTAAGMGQLVKLHKGLRALGRELVLCNVRESALEVFEVVGLTSLLDVRADEPTWRAFDA
jgi:anti-anti-sigma factor